MTALVDTLFQLEKYLGLELDSLLPYAERDDIGGYHPDPTQRKWGSGAIWEVEGRTIYALIRALKPVNVVEIGSGTGCSTTHMARALFNNDKDGVGIGHVTTIDRGNTPQIPDDLKDYVTILPGDAIEWLQQQPDNSIDFILEDADHSEAMCYQVGELAKTKLRPGGVLMVHDAVHPTVGADVRAGYDRAGLDVRTYLTDPSDCGWAVWRRPPTVSLAYNGVPVVTVELSRTPETIAASLADTEPVLQAQEEPNAEIWTPATLSAAQNEMLNLDAKWLAEKNAKQAQEDQRPVKAKRARKAKVKK